MFICWKFKQNLWPVPKPNKSSKPCSVTALFSTVLWHNLISHLFLLSRIKISLTTCCQNGKHAPTRVHYQNNMDALNKSKRAFFPRLLSSVLTPSSSSHTPPWPHCIHLINFLVCVCVFVSWSMVITKCWPLLNRRPPSSCRSDLLLNSLLTLDARTQRHPNTIFYMF